MHFHDHAKLNKISAVILGIFFLASSILLLPNHVGAASYTWDGGGTDGTCGGAAGDGNKWSCAANWSSDIVPTSGDSVTFNGTSTKNASIDASFAGSITTLTIASGYTGTITAQRSLTLSSAFTQSAGTFNGGSQTLDFNSTFTLNSGGTFISTSGTLSVAAAFTINSGSTFTHNNGTVSFDGSSAILDCNNITFNLVTITHVSGGKTVNSNCTLPLGNNPSTTNPVTLNGTLTGTGTLTYGGTTPVINSGAVISGFTSISTGGTTTFNGGTFVGVSSLTSSVIVIAGQVDWGTMTSFTNSSGLTISAPFNASTFTTFDLNSTFTLNSGGVFTAPSGTMSVASNFTINAGTFNHNNGTVTFDASTATLSCNNITFNLVTFTHISGGKTVNSDCTLPLGANPNNTSGGNITLSGTLSGTGTFNWGGTTPIMNAGGVLSGFSTLISGGTMTFNGGSLGSITSYTASVVSIVGSPDWSNVTTFNASTLTVSGTLNLSSVTSSTLTGTFTMNIGSTFTAPSGTMNINSNFTVNGGTFNHNNGIIAFASSTATLSCNNITFNIVTFTHVSGAKTINSNCNLPLGNNPTIPMNITLNGTLTGTGIFTCACGTSFTMNAGSLINGFTNSTITSPFTMNGGTFDGSGGGTVTTTTTFTMAGGTFVDYSSLVVSTITKTAGSFGSIITLTYNGVVSYIWDGGGTDGTCGGSAGDGNKWSCAANWSGDTLPTTSQGAIFDGTSTKNANIDSAAPSTTGQIQMFAGYTGTITMQKDFTIPVILDQFSGTFNAQSYILTMGTWLERSAPAVFTASSNITHVNSYQSLGGVFNSNGGIWNITNTGGSIICSNFPVYTLVTFDGASGSRTLGNGCIYPLGNNPVIPNVTFVMNGSSSLVGTGTLTTAGTISLNSSFSGFTAFNGSTLTITSTASLGAITNMTLSGNFTVSKNIDMSTFTNLDVNGIFTLGAFTYTAPPSMSVAGNFTLNASSTFNHNNGTIIFDGTTAGTITCNSKTLNFVSFTHTAGIKTVGATCSLPLGANPTTAQGGDITLNGNLSGSGTLTVNGTFTMNPGSSLTGFTTLDVDYFAYNGGSFGSVTTILVNGQPVKTWDGQGTDGTCGGNIGDGNKWSCALNWTNDTVPASTDVVFFDTTSTKDSTIDASFQGTIQSLAIFSGYTGTITQTRTLTLSSTYSQADGTFISNNSLIVTGEYTQSAGTFTGSTASMSVFGFTLSGTSNFTATSNITNVESGLSINSSGTFTHNSGTFNFNTANTNTFNCGTAVFNLVTFKYSGNGSTVGTKTLNNSCAMHLGNNPVIEGNLSFNSTLTGSGTIRTGYRLSKNLLGQLNGFTGFDSVIGPTTDSIGSSLSILANNTLDASNYTVLNIGADFTMAAGTTFIAPPSMYIGRGMVLNSTAIFTHNNGIVYFTNPAVPVTSSILNCNFQTFNKVEFIHTNTIKIVAGENTGNPACNLDLGNNPVITGSLQAGNVNPGRLRGTGTITFTNGTLTLGTTNSNGFGRLDGFTKLVANDVVYTKSTNTVLTEIETTGDFTLNQPTYNQPLITKISVGDDFTISSGVSMTAPTTLNVGGDWINNGTFIHNNGLVEFTSNNDRTISGSTTFNNLKVDNSLAPTLSFTAGSTQIVSGLLTLKGTSGALVTLKSTSPGSSWNLSSTGTHSVEYVSVSDSNLSTATITVGCDSYDGGGNNANWEFATDCEPVVSNLGPTEFTSGLLTNDSQPTFTFDISDPDSFDTVRYTIEIDDDSDFSSPLVCYTSELATPGSFSFTVGQAEGDGTYTCGEEDQTLENGTYYVRVSAIDAEGHTSDYLIANDGDLAFFVFLPVEEMPGENTEETPVISTCTTVKSLCPKTIKITKPSESTTDSGTPNVEEPETELPDTGTSEAKSTSGRLLLLLLPFLALLILVVFAEIKKKQDKKEK